MYKPGKVENIELMIYFSPENFRIEIFNNLKRYESENMKQLCFIWINTFMANVFFSTCSSNSVDVDDDGGDTEDDV